MDKVSGELPITSIEKMTIAKQMLAEARSLGDILKVNDLAEAFYCSYRVLDLVSKAGGKCSYGSKLI